MRTIPEPIGSVNHPEGRIFWFGPPSTSFAPRLSIAWPQSHGRSNNPSTPGRRPNISPTWGGGGGAYVPSGGVEENGISGEHQTRGVHGWYQVHPCSLPFPVHERLFRKKGSKGSLCFGADVCLPDQEVSGATPPCPDISAQVYLIPCANTPTSSQVENSFSRPWGITEPLHLTDQKRLSAGQYHESRPYKLNIDQCLGQFHFSPLGKHAPGWWPSLSREDYCLW